MALKTVAAPHATVEAEAALAVAVVEALLEDVALRAGGPAAVDVSLVAIFHAVGATAAAAKVFAGIADIAGAIAVLDAPLPDAALVGADAAAINIRFAGRVKLVVVAVGDAAIGNAEATGRAFGVGPTLFALVVDADVEYGGAMIVGGALAAPEILVAVTANAVGVEDALVEGRAFGTEFAAAVNVGFVAVFAAADAVVDALTVATDERIDAAIVAPGGSAGSEAVGAAAGFAIARSPADCGDALGVAGAAATGFAVSGRGLTRFPESTDPRGERADGEGAKEGPAVRWWRDQPASPMVEM